MIIGGASTDQQIIRAGLFDEVILGLAPVVLGEGLRVFEDLGVLDIKLEKTRVIESPMRIDIYYRVVR